MFIKMNYKDITVGIVTFKSKKVIFNCLKSITNAKKIIIFDNSNDKYLKKKVQKIYPHIRVVLSKKNLGYGHANNQIFKLSKTPYVLILNPDTILKKDCLLQLLTKAQHIKNKFAIIAPSEKKTLGSKKLIEVEQVKGFAMLINLSKIKKIGMFDQNYFLYLEEIDLCRRLNVASEKIYILPGACIKHIGASSSDLGFEFEKCRNWHWMWSRVYFDIKFYNYTYAFRNSFFKLISSFFKMVLFLFLLNIKKSTIHYYRFSGLFNSLLGKKSWYRPKFN